MNAMAHEFERLMKGALRSHILERPLPVEFTFAGHNWPRYVNTLPKGAALEARLKYRREHDGCVGPYYHAPTPNPNGRGFYFSEYGHGEGQPGLRWKYCDTVEGTRIRHKGWYADEDGSETIRGLVFRLPHDRGFLIGWTMGSGMCAAVEYDVWEDEVKAAYGADQLAERVAQDEREYHEQNEEDEHGTEAT